MLKELLAQEEGKTLEFKENASSLSGIVKAVVAFANTSGGTIIVGVEDKTKKVVGLADPLEEEARIINAISASITPLFRPNIEIQTYKSKALVIIQVPYSVGPYYFKKDNQQIAYVRFGSSNRIADEDAIATMKSLMKNTTFDEIPCYHATKDSLDWSAIEDSFKSVDKEITKVKAKSLGLYSNVDLPSNGGVLLFGKDREAIFPDAKIRCVKFQSTTKEKSVDSIEIDEHLPNAIDEVIYFIDKNTSVQTTIGKKRRISAHQYPPVAIREAVINAIVHADYSIKGSSTLVALFDDRIEITNPGCMPYGLSIEDAIAGSSRARNRVIARTFHALELIEQWGSGLQKIIEACAKLGLREPVFEEIGSQFRVTIYSENEDRAADLTGWKAELVNVLRKKNEISTGDAAKLWDIDPRNARVRLNQLVELGLIARIGTSKNDPQGKYILRKK